MKRRNFLTLMGIAGFGTAFFENLKRYTNSNQIIKPVEGSWFEFQHHSKVESKYWDHVLKNFTAEQWDRKVKEIADAGIKYLVLLHIAIDGKTFYPSRLLPKHQLGCDDPLETVLW
jgi:UDP-galactopyranose mutase